MGEGGGIFLGLLIVAFHHIGAFDAYLPHGLCAQGVAAIVFDHHFDPWKWYANVSCVGRVQDVVVGAHSAGLCHAPAFNHDAAGGFKPSRGGVFGGRHSARLGQAQVGKIKLFELVILQQRIEEGVDPWQDVKSSCRQDFHKFFDVPWVGDQCQVGAQLDAQKTKGQGKDMVKRQGCYAIDGLRRGDFAQCGHEPGMGLQGGAEDVAVAQNRTLGETCGATGVL